MCPDPNNVNITKNIRLIEWLKVELVNNVGNLLKAILKGSEGLLVDSIASIIIVVYLLGKRLGINFNQVDLKIESKLKEHIEENHDLEKWYGDLTALLRYWENKKR